MSSEMWLGAPDALQLGGVATRFLGRAAGGVHDPLDDHRVR
jgi:hypothetical protein